MATEVAPDTALEQFYNDVAAHDLQPLWTQAKELMPLHPKPRAVPWMWRWETLRALAARGGELVPIERGGERRVLSLSNPGLGGLPYATPTLWGAVQYLNARESAPAHRHTAAAIRFVIEGDGVWTTVNGDACDMHPGDLILTPAWTWHDHCNNGDKTMIWFDGLDLPLVNALDAIFYENYPELTQPVEGQHNRSANAYAAPGLVPLGEPAGDAYSPLFVYRWDDTDRALTRLLEARGGPMVALEFVDPTRGVSALPTFSCEVRRFAPGGRTRAQRQTGSSVLVVYRGSGSSVIGGQRFDWTRGDMLVVPSWTAVEHEAHEQSDLFAVSDTPMLRALHLFREETLDAPQRVTSVFEPR